MVKKKEERRRVAKQGNGEYWFLGADHLDNEQLYDWAEIGPRSTHELRKWIVNRRVNWLGALARDHFNIPDHLPVSDKAITEYSALKIEPEQVDEPWKISAILCVKSAAKATHLIDSGRFEEAMLWVLSTANCAHGAYRDDQEHDTMRAESGGVKAIIEKEKVTELKMEQKEDRLRELVDELIERRWENCEPLPNKGSLDDFLIEHHKKEIPARDRTKSLTAKRLKKLGIKLPRYSTYRLPPP